MEHKYDIVVVGGGLAGVCAAIAAAREGNKTAIVERYGFFGGMATAGLVNPFMKYETIAKDGTTVPVNNVGLFGLLLEELRSYQALKQTEPGDIAVFNEELLKIILDRNITKYKIQIYFHSFIFGAVHEQDHIQSVRLATKEGELGIKAKMFIDCTGDADLSMYAGCPFEQGRKEDGLCQPMTLNFRLSNLAHDRPSWRKDAKEYKEKVDAVYKQFCLQGKISNPRENILAFEHMDPSVTHYNTTRILHKNSTKVSDLSDAEVQGRKQVLEMYRFIKENLEGHENAVLLSSGCQIGVRESRRIVGMYCLTENDLLSLKKFPTSIARGAYEIDVHNPDGTGTVIKKIPQGEYYTIPYEALIPQKIKNLIVAGRPISATHYAHSAIRIMPICASMGEAAGIAASIAVQDNIAIQNVDVHKLQGILKTYGGLY